MKYIKTFENANTNIKVGDYAVLKNDINPHSNFKHFLDKPCEVISYNFSEPGYNICLKCNNDKIWWKISQIEYHSKNKEDVEAFLASRKYNI